MTNPLRVEWEITSACPLSCPDCSCRQELRGPDLCFDDQLAVAHRIRNLAGLVSLSGGEPLMHSRWEELVACLRQGSTAVQLLTSGSFWDSTMAERILESGISRIWLGVDATGRQHDAFRGKYGLWNQVNQVIEDLRVRDVPFGVVTTIRPENQGQLPAIASWIRKNRISDWYVWRAVTGASSPEVSPRPIRLPAVGPDTRLWIGDTLRPRNVRCEAGESVLGIVSDGRVRGCLLQIGRPFAGHILKTDPERLMAASRAGRPAMGCPACPAGTAGFPLARTAMLTAAVFSLGFSCGRPAGEPTIPSPQARRSTEAESEPPVEPESEPVSGKGDDEGVSVNPPNPKMPACCYSRMMIPDCVCDWGKGQGNQEGQ